MNIDVKVFPASKRSFINQEGDAWKIYLNATAVDGKANKALMALLAVHFKVRKSRIEITKGLKLGYKTISIEDI